MDRRRLLTLAATMLIACVSPATTPTSTQSTPTSTAETPTIPPPTTGTSVPVVTTSATTPPLVSISLPPVFYSQGETIQIEGSVDRLVTLLINDEVVGVDSIGERFSFWVDLTFQPGEHLVEVVATDQDGLVTTLPVLVVVDPDLQLQLAYITHLDSQDGTIAADYADWFSGEEATLAAREDGVLGQDEEISNDYYIRNLNPLIRTLPLAEGLMAILYACYLEGPCVTRQPVDFDTWSALLADPEVAPPQLGWSWYGGGYLPYWLTLRDQTVVQVEEQYLP